MGVLTSEGSYTAAMPRREDHEVHKDMWWQWTKKKPIAIGLIDKYTMMFQSNTTKFYYVSYCIGATCFDSYRIIFRPF